MVRWSLGLAAIAGAGALMLSTFVRSALYPVPPVPVPSPPPAPLVEVSLTSNGLALSAWWLAPRGPEAPVVLMLHGNGENLATLARAGLFDQFAALGAGVLALDYPGYGRSAGRPSEESIVAASLVAWGELVTRAGETHPRVAAGWSLGAAVAARIGAAEPETVDLLLLMSAWTRLGELAAVHFPAWLAGPLLPDRYDTLDATARIRVPSLVVHGAEDRIIPVEQGRRVFAALPEPKRWVEVRGAGHNDLLAQDATWRALATVLDTTVRR